MKSVMGILFLFASLSALAAERPLITKSSGGGFLAPEYGGNERCEIFSNKVIITHQLGFQGPTAMKLVETRSIRLSGDLAGIIQQAKSENAVSKPNFLCDGPSTSIVASSPTGENVLLFETGGCGSPGTVREGIASQKLTKIVDMYCPTTYKGGMEH